MAEERLETRRSCGARRARRRPPRRHPRRLRTIREQERATHRAWRRGCRARHDHGGGTTSWSTTTTPAGSRPYARPARTTGPACSGCWCARPRPHRHPGDGGPPRGVTGVGHGRLMFERSTLWGWFSVGDLFLLNFLTITAGLIGIGLGAGGFGVSPYLAVPVGALFLVGITVTGRFSTWEQLMFLITQRERPGDPPARARPSDPGARPPRFPGPGHPGWSELRRGPARSSPSSAPRWRRGSSSSSSRTSSTSASPRGVWIAYERTDTVVGALLSWAPRGDRRSPPRWPSARTPLAGQLHDAETRRPEE